jgi:hypothetical protein
MKIMSNSEGFKKSDKDKIQLSSLRVEENNELTVFTSEAYKIHSEILVNGIYQNKDSKIGKVVANLLSEKDIEAIAERVYMEELKEKDEMDFDSYLKLRFSLLIQMIKNFSIWQIQNSSDIQEEIGIYQPHIIGNSKNVLITLNDESKVDNKDYFWVFYLAVKNIGFKKKKEFEGHLVEIMETLNINHLDSKDFRIGINNLTRNELLKLLFDAVSDCL